MSGKYLNMPKDTEIEYLEPGGKQMIALLSKYLDKLKGMNEKERSVLPDVFCSLSNPLLSIKSDEEVK